MTGYLINVEWPIENDAEDKRGCQGVQIIIGKPIILENYTNDDIHVPISELLKEC